MLTQQRVHLAYLQADIHYPLKKQKKKINFIKEEEKIISYEGKTRANGPYTYTICKL
jgi:hypothetical protein